MVKPLSNRQKLALTWLAMGFIALLFLTSMYIEGRPRIVGVFVCGTTAMGCLIWALRAE